ncbi:citrate synthase [Roseibium sp. CAU 1637]|uniref:citrate synthase (unknown stereospecificity) n=1 Tax=Roseibium limicola TaxID=2816037 RepID=A0A939ERB8_9HYPH|nr:citrate synthase [Roseibium limicola]MBO0347249.1 citrate synthase [Roseibium limicola]
MTLAPTFDTSKLPPISDGLEGIVVAETVLSDVQGAAGRLTLRGKSVEELAETGSFDSAVEHLTRDLLPTSAPAQVSLAEGRSLAWEQIGVLRAADPDLSAFEMMTIGLAALPSSAAGENSLMLAGALSVFLAGGYRLKAGLEPIAPDATAETAADLLRMLTGSVPPAAHVAGLNRYLTTVLDHGLNASTFAARVIASTNANAKAGLLGAMGALSGPLHGGAPGPVLDMLDAAQNSGNVRAWIGGELRAGRRLMGFGHRVYRTRDPRADVLKTGLAALSKDSGRVALAEEIEREALSALALHKPERKLDTNVEFYTAVLLEAIGIDRSLFTPLFAVGRAPGWCAHMAEQQAKGRLIRPQSRYVGP